MNQGRQQRPERRSKRRRNQTHHMNYKTWAELNLERALEDIGKWVERLQYTALDIEEEPEDIGERVERLQYNVYKIAVKVAKLKEQHC